MLADATVFLHLAFVLFVVAGGLLVVRWPRAALVHLPAVAWAAWVEFAGWICPLTPLEQWLRVRGGQASYTSSFIDEYLMPVLYPSSLTREVQWVLGGWGHSWRPLFGKTRTDVGFVAFHPRMGWFVTDRFELFGEATLFVYHEPEAAVAAGLGGIAGRYYLRTSGRWIPFVMTGAGLLWTSLDVPEIDRVFNGQLWVGVEMVEVEQQPVVVEREGGALAKGHVHPHLDLEVLLPQQRAVQVVCIQSSACLDRRVDELGEGGHCRLGRVQPEAEVVIGEGRVEVGRLVPVWIPAGPDMHPPLVLTKTD